MSVSETALSRERAKRCEWCAKGIPLIAAFHVLEDVVDCVSPSDADLYEELAKERDGLRENLRKQISERDKTISKLRDEIHEWEESDAAAVVLKPTLSEAMDEVYVLREKVRILTEERSQVKADFEWLDAICLSWKR